MHPLSDAKVPKMFESTNIAIYDATATGLAIGVIKEAGIDVIEATEKMMGTALADGSMQLRVKQKRALETAVQQNIGHSTVISSADCANILKEFVNVIKKYENQAKTYE